MLQLRDSEELPFDTGSCFFFHFIKVAIFEYCGRVFKTIVLRKHKREMNNIAEIVMLTGSCHEEGAASYWKSQELQQALWYTLVQSFLSRITISKRRRSTIFGLSDVTILSRFHHSSG